METVTLDEVIINFVRRNACLYDKKNMDFKNINKKKDVWQTISYYLKNLYNVDLPANVVEKRWTSLRDMFTRESRRQKLLPLEGSESTKEWELYRKMLFLTPYIAHRRTKKSLPRFDQSCCIIQSEIEKDDPLTIDYVNMPLSPATTDDYNIYIKSDKANNARDKNDAVITSADEPTDDMLSQSSSVFSSCSNSVQSPTSNVPPNSQKLKETSLCKPIKKLATELDAIAKRRRSNKYDQLTDRQLIEASSAISAAVNSISSLLSYQTEAKNGYMSAIEEGLIYVPDKQKTQCLIEVLQVIQKYEERQ